MLKRLSSFLAASAVVTLAACGGGDGGPNWADEIDSETAAGLGESAAEAAEALAQNMLSFSFSDIDIESPTLVAGTTTPTAAERLIAQIRASAYRGSQYRDMATTPSPYRVSAVCVPVESGIDEFGDPIDSDEDGVPDDYTLSFPSNCTEVDGDVTMTWSGSARIRDVAGLYGFRLDVNNLRLRYSAPDGFEQISYDGTEQGVYAAGGITHSSDLSVGLSAHASGAVGAGPQTARATDLAITYRQIETSSFDPDGTITVEAVGDGLLTFEMDYRFTFDYSDDSESFEEAFRFAMATTSALDIDDACPGPIDGTVVGDLNGNDAIGFTIDWSACNTYTVVVRGTTDPVAVTAAR